MILFIGWDKRKKKKKKIDNTQSELLAGIALGQKNNLFM